VLRREYYFKLVSGRLLRHDKNQLTPQRPRPESPALITPTDCAPSPQASNTRWRLVLISAATFSRAANWSRAR
jgi:hypothetical protein